MADAQGLTNTLADDEGMGVFNRAGQSLAKRREMQSLKMILMSLAMLACTYFGAIEGVSGAQNVMMVFIWAMCLPIGLLALHPTVHKALAEKPPTPIASAVSRFVSLLILGILVWTGFIATGVAWGFYLFCAAVARSGADKLRSAAQKA